MTWFLDLRAQAIGGGLSGDVTVRQGEFVYSNPGALFTAAQNKNVLLATHGFNVDRRSGINALSAWENVLTLGVESLFIGILWPGDSDCWVRGLDYPAEAGEAMASGRLLAQFLNENLSIASSLSFASHSLGGRVVLEAIRWLYPARPRRLTLMASAIEDDCLTKEYRDAAAKVTEVSVLASRRDGVLKWLFPLGDLASKFVTPGHPYWRGALGRHGPIPAGDVRHHWMIQDSWNMGHGHYLGGDPPAIPPVADVPPPGTNPPPNDKKPNWSAAFVSGRFI